MALTPGPQPAASAFGHVAERLALVRARIAEVGIDPDRITIVAVTKGQPPEAADAAVAAGLHDLGENFADDLLVRAARQSGGQAARAARQSGGQAARAARQSGGQAARAARQSGERAARAARQSGERAARESVTPRWHFLGRVQRNKVSRLAATVHLWQGVDRLAAGREIARRAPGAQVLVQVNVSAEPRKNGCRPDETEELVDGLRALGLDVLGLMTVGPAGPPEMARAGFGMLRGVADRLSLRERSMGMSDDLDVAVQEGATMVRVGRALFGTRTRRL